MNSKPKSMNKQALYWRDWIFKKESNKNSGNEELIKRDEEWTSKRRNRAGQMEKRMSDIEDRSLEMMQMKEGWDVGVNK